MHATKLLHNRLQQSAPEIHQARLNAFISAVHSAVHGARLTIASLGRGLQGTTRDKHKIKRVDRLLGNAVCIKIVLLSIERLPSLHYHN